MVIPMTPIIMVAPASRTNHLLNLINSSLFLVPRSVWWSGSQRPAASLHSLVQWSVMVVRQLAPNNISPISLLSHEVQLLPLLHQTTIVAALESGIASASLGSDHAKVKR
jgi:hypothetical protein